MFKLIYLAGRSDVNTYSGGLDWREYAIRELASDGFPGFSPMEKSNDALEPHDSRGLALNIPPEIQPSEEDYQFLDDLLESDALAQGMSDIFPRREGSRGVWNTRYDTPLQNMLKVERSDLVLCNLLRAKKVSIETMMEYSWATSFKKPMITVLENQGGVYEHPMIRGLSRNRVETLDEGIAAIREFLSD